VTLELAEIQGLIVSGYGERPCAKFVLFAIDDVTRARDWLGKLVERVQYGDFMISAKGEPPYLHDVCINIAFTQAGFARLGVPRDTRLGFSGSFRGGMSAKHRTRQLGDDGASAPESWLWGGPAGKEVHGVLLVYAGSDDGDPAEDERCAMQIAREVHADHGLVVVATRDTLPMRRDNRAEHFGFADGIANPTLEGLRRPHHRDVIADGEVVLGYPNAYGKYGLSPLVSADDPSATLLPASRLKPARRDFGKNGSYLVFRELSQDVSAFWRFMDAAASALPDAPSPVWVASRMVGRWPNGLPVTHHPEVDDPHRFSDDNAFGYHDKADYFGTACPIGSHIRRTNPRETLLPMPHDPPPTLDLTNAEHAKVRTSVSDRHRLMRRGRSYGPRRAERFDLAALKEPDDAQRGLHFLCVVANIRRQFEFVQGTWALNPNFAGLSRDPDPLIAARRTYPFEASSFVVPGCPARFIDGIPRFVETRGGGYFFLPSRSALRYLAALGRSHALPDASPARASADDCAAIEALERAKVERDFAAQRGPKRARRAFHPRCHGIVQALLQVDEDLPAAWEAGVFQRGARYPAWVRFSSGSFTNDSDERRDLHGLAIKLMNVPEGPRASHFEAHTQDFVLVDAPRLMVRDLAEGLAYERALQAGKLARLAYLARHPGLLMKLRAICSTPSHPLARTYNSVTPFAYGPERAVRWVVRQRHGETLVPSQSGPHALREALSAQLACGPVTLELCVQSRGTRALDLEDASRDWRVAEERVATLVLKPDGFGEHAQEELGESLSFNPWNALEEHRPLGAMNAARKLVYRSLYELRRRLGGTLPVEPTP
jgi:Dyp-type peroxidase family